MPESMPLQGLMLETSWQVTALGAVVMLGKPAMPATPGLGGQGQDLVRRAWCEGGRPAQL